MQTGDLAIVAFPYTDLVSFKARPAVVITDRILPYQLILHPDKINNLKVTSVIKVSRLVTVEETKVLAVIGKLFVNELDQFKRLFKSLVD